jgi:hypothetical protein
MEIIEIEKVNETYNKIIADPSTIMELSGYFTFDVPGAKFTPAYRNKFWDGKIRLLNPITCLLYGGLNSYVEEFARSRQYQVIYKSDFSADEFSVKEARDFINTINLYVFNLLIFFLLQLDSHHFNVSMIFINS